MFDIPEFGRICSSAWENDDSDTKYKMGQKVRVKGKDICAEIIGVNILSEEEIEYALDGQKFLFWEEELELL